MGWRARLGPKRIFEGQVLSAQLQTILFQPLYAPTAAERHKIAGTHHFGGGPGWSYIHSVVADGFAEGKWYGGPHFYFFGITPLAIALATPQSPEGGQKRNTS
jgi:hypothetical protein